MFDQFTALRPAGGFGLIMADPPWPYKMRSAKGYAKSPEAQYRTTMDLKAIKALPIEMLAAPNCLLWLWAVNPQLPQAIDVLRAWGFTFKTAGTWIKRGSRGGVAFGTGYILRSSNEPFLVGTRGKPRTTRATRSAVISYDDTAADVGDDSWPFGTVTIEAVAREHSRKPDEAYLACDELMPGIRKLDLFSCQARPGWTAWGDEADKFGGAA